MYDALVVGAGPAGCAAAKLLAERGLRTLLVERCKLPRYKSCSGQLIERSLRLTREIFGAEPPAGACCAPRENRGTVLFDERGREFRFEQSGLNVWRASFDAWLAERAIRSGAELREGTMLAAYGSRADFLDVRLKTARGIEPVRARWLIDCGGAADGIGPGAGERIATLQTFNRGRIELDPHYFYAFLQPELSGYDAWCNVKDDWLVLGVAAPVGEDLRSLHARFLAHLRRGFGLRLEEEFGADRWVLPRVCPGCPLDLGAGRVLRAGEAAGFLNPMGEGVSCALESGRLAALALLLHFADPVAVRAAYESSAAGPHAYMRRQWSLVSQFSRRFAELR